MEEQKNRSYESNESLHLIPLMFQHQPTIDLLAQVTFGIGLFHK